MHQVQKFPVLLNSQALQLITMDRRRSLKSHQHFWQYHQVKRHLAFSEFLRQAKLTCRRVLLAQVLKGILQNQVPSCLLLQHQYTIQSTKALIIRKLNLRSRFL